MPPYPLPSSPLKMNAATPETLVVHVEEVGDFEEKQTFFKIKPTTSLRKLQDAYVQRSDDIKNRDDVCFFVVRDKETDSEEHGATFYDKETILCESHMTANSLSLQEGDKIWITRTRKSLP